MAMPGSTPSRATPRKAAIDRANSVRRTSHSRLIPVRSARDKAAAITTAASVGWGRFRNSPGTTRSMSTITPAPTRPVTCVLAPDWSATAVREPLVLTGNPWKSPAATFDVPMPIISWLA